MLFPFIVLHDLFGATAPPCRFVVVLALQDAPRDVPDDVPDDRVQQEPLVVRRCFQTPVLRTIPFEPDPQLRRPARDVRMRETHPVYQTRERITDPGRLLLLHCHRRRGRNGCRTRKWG